MNNERASTCRRIDRRRRWRGPGGPSAPAAYLERSARATNLVALQPIRQSRDRLIRNKDGELERALELAVGKLGQAKIPHARRLILILVDAHDDAPCVLGPRLLELSKKLRADQDIACVIANVEYETWFVAAADSLRSELDLSRDASLPMEPEKARSGKAWIEKRIRRDKYSETSDQARLTSTMNVGLCRRLSPSFDKLCRDLEARASTK